MLPRGTGKEIIMNEVAQVCNKVWITPRDIQLIVPELNIRLVRKLCRDILKEMDDDGEYHFSTKEMLVPTSRVLFKLGIKKEDAKYFLS